jgi:hypothetical protein
MGVTELRIFRIEVASNEMLDCRKKECFCINDWFAGSADATHAWRSIIFYIRIGTIIPSFIK